MARRARPCSSFAAANVPCAASAPSPTLRIGAWHARPFVRTPALLAPSNPDEFPGHSSALDSATFPPMRSHPVRTLHEAVPIDPLLLDDRVADSVNRLDCGIGVPRAGSGTTLAA